MRDLPLALMLCACTSVEIVPPAGEGGGGNVQDPTGGTAVVGGTAGDGANGGEGGSPIPTIVVDAELPASMDANEVVVLVSTPDGEVKQTFLGGELPVGAAADPGDLVTYFYVRGIWSYALMYRVAPGVSEVLTRPWMLETDTFCQVDDPMTLILDVPEVPGATYYDLRLDGANNPMWQLDPGLNEIEVRGCPGTESFDLVVAVQQYSGSEPVAVARIDDIPYADGLVTSLPIELTSERILVDIEVEGEPGTSFGSITSWSGQGFGTSGYSVQTTATHAIGSNGTASLSDGPFALGAGAQRVSVSVPPPYFSCELDLAWKTGPFDGSPLHARFGALAGFAPLPDGNVALGAEGEVGDVLLRTEDDYASAIPSYWVLYEDPSTPYPLPVKPEVPANLLPDFTWPGPAAELRYVHYDYVPTDGYGDYASTAPDDTDGRALHRVPAGCF